MVSMLTEDVNKIVPSALHGYNDEYPLRINTSAAMHWHSFSLQGI